MDNQSSFDSLSFSFLWMHLPDEKFLKKHLSIILRLVFAFFFILPVSIHRNDILQPTHISHRVIHIQIKNWRRNVTFRDEVMSRHYEKKCKCKNINKKISYIKKKCFNLYLLLYKNRNEMFYGNLIVHCYLFVWLYVCDKIT